MSSCTSYTTVILLFVLSSITFGLTSAQNKWLTDIWISEWGPIPTQEDNFFNILYYKNSNERGELMREGFQELVECSTGQKNCNASSVREEIFGKKTPLSIFTNCTLNPSLSPLHCKALKECITAEEMLTLVDSTGGAISQDSFERMLPLIIYQAQEQLCRSDDLDGRLPLEKKKPSSSEVWGYGFLFVSLISGCSLAGVTVLPVMARDFYQQLLTTLVGLAAGSLSASAVFHLIPQAFNLISEEDKEHSYLFTSLYVLLGIWMFFMIERIMKIIISYNEDRKQLMRNMSGLPVLEREADKDIQMSNGHCITDNFSHNNEETAEAKPSINHDVQLIYASQEQAIKASFGHDDRPVKTHDHHERVEFRQGEDSVIATVAWMIIFGDGFHNFIDGISIGAAFSESILTGISISLAVMCEELPHELGDFAVLLNSGMTMKQAVTYNFISATTCYMGLVVGILVGEVTQNSTPIFALAAGMFLYIALVDMVPEMNEVASKASKKGLGHAAKVLLWQNIA
ncbi:metal cation symporter ZIP14-like isoform X2 [Oratosquilla oratoria]|uniref:metal cation symporter ZIP14-like isoform X2 n=1 Tax=Oratosquilla oratoria TaxID=337810 RepID=UPI003F76664A